MEVKLFKYQYRSGPQNAYYNCGAGMYAVWRDIGQKIVNGPTRFSDYRLVATEGESVYSLGQTLSDSLLNIVVPEGYYGIYSGSTGTQAGGAYSSACSYYESIYATWVGGGVVPPNPFRVTEWWAIYSVPAGRVIAGFEWQQMRGLDVAFDGGFRLSREVEVTGAKPVVSYEWDFGDGKAPSSSARPTHTYDQPGVYTVSLTVTDDDDEQDTETRRVTVRGVVLEYTATATGTVEIGDTMYVSLSVTNVGTLKAATVNLPRDYRFPPTYPESILTKSTDARRMALSSIADSVVTDLGPGATVNVGQSYKVLTGAVENDAGVKRDVPVRWKVSVIGLGGVDESGFPAAVNNSNECERGTGCTDETLVVYKPMAVTAKSSTIDGETASVNAGLKKRVSDLFPKGRFEHLLRSGLGAELECNSGCTDLEIAVKDPAGAPVEGAVVELSRVLLDTDASQTSVVTPDQGGGVFCFETQCGKTLKLPPTDAQGKQKVRFWVPGVTWPVEAYLTAKATNEGFQTTEYEHQVLIRPTKVEAGTNRASPSDADMFALSIASGLQQVADLPNWPKKICTTVIDWALKKDAEFAGTRVDGLLKKALAKAIDWTCSEGLAEYITDDNTKRDDELKSKADQLALIDAFGKAASVLGVWWFQGQFQLSLAGTGETGLTRSPPFLTHASEFVDAISEANRSLAFQFVTTGVRPTITFDLWEVSHKKENTDEVQALYFTLNTTPDNSPKVDYKKLITKNYNKSIFLTQEPVESTTTLASEFEQIVTLESPNGKLATEDDSTFAVGHVVMIDPGLETQERVQIVAITGSMLGLSVPLKYNHAAGSRVAYVDSLELGPPAAPVNVGGVSGLPGASRMPTLSWYSFAPASSYLVEVATDTLFADIVQTHADLTESDLTLDQLDDRTRYYWRVAASNLSGQGEWSAPYSFYTGRPYGDDLSEARPFADELGIGRFAWHVAATAEPDEAFASCGGDGNSLWYEYTPSTSGAVAFETFNSGFSTVLSVWTGSAHPLTEVACNDDHVNPGGDAVKQSYLDIDAVAGTKYYIRVTGSDGEEGALILTIRGPTQVGTEDPESPTPMKFALSAYPNPTNGIATVTVDHTEPGPLQVDVYDMLGRRQVQLAGNVYAAGTHTFTFDASGLATGVYMVMASTPRSRVVRPLTIVR